MKERLHFDLDRIRKLKEDVENGIRYPAELDNKAVVTATSIAVGLAAGVALTMIYKFHQKKEDTFQDSDWPATEYKKLSPEQ